MPKSGAPFAWGSPSAADSQPLDEGLVSALILLLDIVEKRSPLRHHLEQAAAGVVVLDVGLEVTGQVGDALGENRNLDFGRPSVADFQTVLIDERRLALSGDRHRLFLKLERKTAHSISGRTGMSSRSVATRIPALYHVADRALIQISWRDASPFSLDSTRATRDWTGATRLKDTHNLHHASSGVSRRSRPLTSRFPMTRDSGASNGKSIGPPVAA